MIYFHCSLFVSCIYSLYNILNLGNNHCKKFPPTTHLFQPSISIELLSWGYRVINKYITINKIEDCDLGYDRDCSKHQKSRTGNQTVLMDILFALYSV